MSLSLIVFCLWVVASTIVAMLPMRLQYAPGLALLIAVPFGLTWIAFDHGFCHAVKVSEFPSKEFDTLLNWSLQYANA